MTGKSDRRCLVGSLGDVSAVNEGIPLVGLLGREAPELLGAGDRGLVRAQIEVVPKREKVVGRRHWPPSSASGSAAGGGRIGSAAATATATRSGRAAPPEALISSPRLEKPLAQVPTGTEVGLFGSLSGG